MSKSNKSSNKRKNKHKEIQKEKIKEKKAVLQLSEEEKKEFTEKYGRGGVIKNTLKIWKDSSPITFMTYFPVILSQVIFTALWFLASIIMFIRPLSEYGFMVRDFLTFFNSAMAAFGIPLILSYLHLKYNIKNKKYYFFNTLVYTLPASLIYVILNFLNVLITVMFNNNNSELIASQLELSFYILLAMIGTIMVTSCVAQMVLLSKRSKNDHLVTKLGLKINEKKK